MFQAAARYSLMSPAQVVRRWMVWLGLIGVTSAVSLGARWWSEPSELVFVPDDCSVEEFMAECSHLAFRAKLFCGHRMSITSSA